MSNTVLSTEEIAHLKAELELAITAEKKITQEIQAIRKTNYESNDSDIVMKNDIIMKNMTRELHTARTAIEKLSAQLATTEE